MSNVGNTGQGNLIHRLQHKLYNFQGGVYRQLWGREDRRMGLWKDF